VPDAGSTGETARSLNHPARLVEPLERCMQARLAPGRSGWSSAAHLQLDLERALGVRAPIAAVVRALRELGRRRNVRLLLDDAGTLWYRVRPDDAQAP